jgi:hypothetical protein
MKQYLLGIIGEYLRRAELLTLRIPSPLPSAELSGVAQRCSDRLRECVEVLHSVRIDTDLGNPDYAGLHLRILRRVIRSLFEVEVYALPAMARFTDDERFLTKLLFQLHQEIGYPLPPPIAACFASGYYWSYPEWNVVYVPLAESEMILHLPDLVHEMGHILIYHLLDPRIAPFCERYGRCLQIVDQHYRRQLANRRASGGPHDYLRLEAHFRQQWLDKWLEEIVCDLFAMFVLGPPFVWAHCHLAAKLCKHIFSFSHDQLTTHPADDARMKAMLAGLQLSGFDDEARAINKQWKQLVKILGHKKDADYHLAYPDNLIEAIAVEAHQGASGLGCRKISKELATKDDDSSVVGLLNNAWNTFWQNPEEYSKWEEKRMQIWRQRLIIIDTPISQKSSSKC